MPDHAGLAAEVTVRERVLNVALRAAYANGSFKVLNRELRCQGNGAQRGCCEQRQQRLVLSA
jgi:hypothetical protein